MFKLNKNPDGSISQYKSRLVAKGFHQQVSLDSSKTFSPVVKPTAIRVVCTSALARGQFIRQLDINKAFLMRFLKDIYMEQSSGFNLSTSDTSLVCKLNKAIYGLKQAPQAQFERLQDFLPSVDFISFKSGSSFFLRFTNKSTMFILVYVDGIITTGSSNT